MNYQRIYNNIINRAKDRIITGYFEIHHIMPKCLGGSDDESNLVKLTASEHFICHQLLVKMYPNNHKLIHAARMMCVNNKHQRNRSNNKFYSWLRERNQKIQKGKLVSKSTRIKMSNAVKNKKRISCKYCGKTGLVGNINRWHNDNCKLSPTPKNHKLTQEHKDKVSKTLQNLKWEMLTCPHCNETHKKCVINQYHNERCVKNPNRVIPQRKQETLFTCKHCGIVANKGNINRWHNDNCKSLLDNCHC